MRNSIDEKLREKFKRDLPDAPHNPWFVQKIMNRLPERKSDAASVIEYAGFIIAGIILGFYWYMLVSNTAQSDVIVVKDIIHYAILVAMTFSLAIGFIVSLLQKN